MPGICSTVCSYVCSPCVLVKNLLCGQPKKVKVDDATGDDFNDPRFDVEYGTGRGDGSFAFLPCVTLPPVNCTKICLVCVSALNDWEERRAVLA